MARLQSSLRKPNSRGEERIITSFGIRRPKLCKSAGKLHRAPNILHHKLDPECLCCFKQELRLRLRARRIVENAEAFARTGNPLENIQLLSVELGGKNTHTRGVATGSCQTRDQTRTDNVVDDRDDRDRLSCLLGCAYGCVARGDDHTGTVAHETARQLWKPLRVPFGEPKLDPDIAAVDLPERGHGVAKDRLNRLDRLRCVQAQNADQWGIRWTLGQSRKWAAGPGKTREQPGAGSMVWHRSAVLHGRPTGDLDRLGEMASRVIFRTGASEP